VSQKHIVHHVKVRKNRAVEKGQALRCCICKCGRQGLIPALPSPLVAGVYTFLKYKIKRKEKENK
jgi:hypothetical protein